MQRLRAHERRMLITAVVMMLLMVALVMWSIFPKY